MNIACVVTTIQPPTDALRAVSCLGMPMIVIGDRKGPAAFALAGARFYSLAEQTGLPFSLARLLPTGHYVRKNLGYLLAMQSGAAAIYETDDDNTPTAAFVAKGMEASARAIEGQGWVNVYRLFSGEKIWPRGFPLALLGHGLEASDTQMRKTPVHQLLTNNAPDVDAIWRLTIGGEPFAFENRPAVFVGPGQWCPFNSQATWWMPEAYPLLYLPATSTFRMTDIWRSLVAQRCLWEMGMGVAFHTGEIVQARNPHDLMRDFAEEVPGYLHNEAIANTLASLKLSSDIKTNLRACYEALVAREFLKSDELALLDAWLADISRKAAKA